MATTTNFGWTTPDDTAYVKDGANAIRTLGSAIDTSMAELKGGTTGQILSKTSNTDMDFTWTADNGIPVTIVDAKGDLIAATGADAVARVAVGTDGQVLTADAASAAGVKWATISGGGMTLIATASPSGASTVAFTSIPTTYKMLWLVWKNVYQSANNTTFKLTVNGDNNVRYNYQSLNFNGSTTPTYTAEQGAAFGQSAQHAIIGYTQSVPTGASNGFFRIWEANTTNPMMAEWGSLSYGTSATCPVYAVGYYTNLSAAAVTRLDLIRSSTQTITGSFLLYGVS